MPRPLPTIAAAAAVTGFLAFGGLSLASAQEDGGTPSTVEETPSTATPDDGATGEQPATRRARGGCDDGAGTGTGSAPSDDAGDTSSSAEV